MESYFEFLAKQNHTAAAGRNVLYGFLALHSKSPESDRVGLADLKQVLKGWQRLIWEAERDPLPEEVLFALFEWLVLHGYLQTAMAALLQFDTYGRPSEILSLQHNQICRPHPHIGKQYSKNWSVCFAPSESGARTKAGEQDDTVLIGACGRQWFLKFFESYLGSTYINPSSLVFPALSLPLYTRHLKMAVE
eukprot:8338580-Karenia_brevis.AAC.1